MNDKLDIEKELRDSLGNTKGKKLYDYIVRQLNKNPKLAGRYISDDKSDRVLILEEYRKNNLIPVIWYNLKPSGFENPSFKIIDFDMLSKEELTKILI